MAIFLFCYNCKSTRELKDIKKSKISIKGKCKKCGAILSKNLDNTLLKIFVSCSREDGSDFADFIKEQYERDGHRVFIDSSDIKPGKGWSESIRNSIDESDIVVVIITSLALRSSEIEKEVLEARKQNKTIIPCIYRRISWSELKWDLDKLPGFQFDNKNSLIRQLNDIICSENTPAIQSSQEVEIGEKPIRKNLFSSLGLAYMPVEALTVASLYFRKVIPLEIQRYPYARFPDKVIIDDVIPLEVIIKSFKPKSLRKITSINLKVDDINQKEVPVQVIVECEDDGFEIIGKYYATINVPIILKDSNSIIFNVKAIKEGLHTIYIRFYQQETYVGAIKLESLVTLPKNQGLLSILDIECKEWKSNSAILKNIIPGPDITIFIYEKKISSDFEYDVLVSSYDIPIQEMGPIKFPFNPETIFHKLFEDIENLNTPSVTIIDRKIKSKGMSLYDELFPESLKELYWEKRDRIKSIRIISKEPWIPWEIIKPWRKLEDGSIEEDDFLCERHAFSRWLVGKHERFKEKIKSIKVVVPDDTNLDAAIKERDWIERFAKQRNIKISFDSSYDQIFNTLETEKEIDILHFSTHGQNNTESPLLSVIELKGNVQLRPEEIVGKAMTFGQSHPIVILNACQTATQGFSLTGIQGWATKFLEAGASVFIGTLWSVNDETAFNFVKEFYNQLSSGVTVGESVKNARNKCKKDGNTSWLAYQLYGHPNSTIKF